MASVQQELHMFSFRVEVNITETVRKTFAVKFWLYSLRYPTHHFAITPEISWACNSNNVKYVLYQQQNSEHRNPTSPVEYKWKKSVCVWWNKLSDLLLQYSFHLLVLKVVCDGGEEVPGVVTLQRAAAVWKGSHDGFVVAEDLQTAQEQRFTLTSWHHHLVEENFTTETLILT